MFDVNEIRKDFPILDRKINGNPLIYMDNAATTQKPKKVIDALVEYYEQYNANVHRGVHTLSMEATEKFEEARNKIANFINAEIPESIIWTRNASESLNLVSHSWGNANISEGDEILLTPMEHHSNLVPWQEIAREKGAKIRFIPMHEDGTLDISDIGKVLNHRTKLVSVVHMSNALGTINPVKVLGDYAHSVGAKFLVDGAQSVPHMVTDVQDITSDVFSDSEISFSVSTYSEGGDIYKVSATDDEYFLIENRSNIIKNNNVLNDSDEYTIDEVVYLLNCDSENDNG